MLCVCVHIGDHILPAHWQDSLTSSVHAPAGSREARLLHKMQGGLPASSASLKPSSLPIGNAMRVASKARLVQAMQDSPACRHAPNLKQAAQVLSSLHDVSLPAVTLPILCQGLTTAGAELLLGLDYLQGRKQAKCNSGSV